MFSLVKLSCVLLYPLVITEVINHVLISNLYFDLKLEKLFEWFIYVIKTTFTENASAVKKLPFTFSLIFQLYRESGWKSLFAGENTTVTTHEVLHDFFSLTSYRSQGYYYFIYLFGISNKQ